MINDLIDISKEFAIEIINVCSDIQNDKRGKILVDQLLRSGTGIGANIHEGNYASSRADFIHKFHIALKECYETDYWLTIFRQTGIINEQQYQLLFSRCSKIRKLLIASINTAKKNMDKQ